jgi:glycosyltransferase involved in cell wall biosynthesis
VRVLLAAEGTYPYVPGGVSTWAHSLVTGLDHHDFTVVSIIANPVADPAYPVPDNVALITVPLWGSELVEEFVARPGVVARNRRTSGAAIGREFLPLLEALLDQMLVAVGDPSIIAEALVGLARFSSSYDLRRALQDDRSWGLMLERFSSNPLYLHTSMGDAIDLARSLFRYLIPLTVPLPEVDVVHAAAAAFCVFPALVAKFDRGTPFMLSEHGVYLRERILDLVRSDIHPLGKTLFSNFYRGLCAAAYRYADLIVPVCSYNTRWEYELGVRRDQVRVVYNGVDPDVFSPGPNPSDRPTVAYVGRVDPLKDTLTLVRAARLVRRRIPEVVFRVWGPPSDDAYLDRCLQEVAALGLEETVVFEGPTDDVVSAYRACDVVALSSLSEGFPFAAVEAMMCGRTVVATAVGGVAEALADPSLLAEPQDARALAERLVFQLERPRHEREELGAILRERALALFARDKFLAEYDALYAGIGEVAAAPAGAAAVEVG